jgi:hypothetical protein
MQSDGKESGLARNLEHSKAPALGNIEVSTETMSNTLTLDFCCFVLMSKSYQACNNVCKKRAFLSGRKGAALPFLFVINVKVRYSV